MVVFGGMVVSTLLDQIVTPTLFFKYGCKVYRSESAAEAESQDGHWEDSWMAGKQAGAHSIMPIAPAKPTSLGAGVTPTAAAPNQASA